MLMKVNGVTLARTMYTAYDNSKYILSLPISYPRPIMQLLDT